MKRMIPAVLVVGALALAACGGSSNTNNSSGTTANSGGSSATTTSGSSGSSSSGNSGSSGAAPTATLTEDGSSLLYPFLQTISPAFSSKYPTIKFQPAAGGSGKGISDAAAGNVSFGGSDAYLSASEMAEYSGLENIPIVISSQEVDYNLKGINNLKLNGTILAGIYEGKITKWNDSSIKAINPGVNLPDEAIRPVHRSDSSGDTFLFTSYLTKTDKTWASGPGEGTTVNWPAVSGEATADGNPGMAQACGSTPGCVAYIGISAQSDATKAGLSPAMLENASGQYVSNTSSSVAAAVSAGSGSVPSNLAASLIDESGSSSYPIVNFEYIIVKKQQKSSSTATAIKDFLNFATSPSGGSSQQYLAKEQFQALPSSVLSKVQTAINGIS